MFNIYNYHTTCCEILQIKTVFNSKSCFVGNWNLNVFYLKVENNDKKEVIFSIEGN